VATWFDQVQTNSLRQAAGQTLKCTQTIRRARQDAKGQLLTLMKRTTARVFFPDLTIGSNCAKNRWAGCNGSDKSS
jgi:hypothetical protein